MKTISNLRAGVSEKKRKKKKLPNYLGIIVSCRWSLSDEGLRAQCGQENLATDVRCNVRFHHHHHPSSILVVPHSYGRVAWQEDNTMTESEVQGVEGEEGGSERDWPEVRRSTVCRLPNNPAALSGLQDERRTKQASRVRRHKNRRLLASLKLGSFAQGHYDDCMQPNCQQHDH